MGYREMEIRELPPEERPREKLFKNGVKNLSDTELVSILLGKGVRGKGLYSLSQEVLSMLDRNNYRIEEKFFLDIGGLGKAKAASLAAAFELSRRILCPEAVRIKSPADLYLCVKHYADRKQELFISVSLNGAHEVIAIRTVTIGLINRSLVHPREVFADPLSDRAAAVIVCHNHPSGNLEPSTEDRDVTKRLSDAGEVLGVPLLDHIIFSQKGYFSIFSGQTG